MPQSSSQFEVAANKHLTYTISNSTCRTCDVLDTSAAASAVLQRSAHHPVSAAGGSHHCGVLRLPTAVAQAAGGSHGPPHKRGELEIAT
jgi:hypothetical protein